MARNPVVAAEEILTGGVSAPADVRGPDASMSAWERLVRLALRRASARGRGKAVESACQAPLASPAETAGAHVEEIEQAAQAAGLDAGRANVARTIGRWWTEAFGDERDPEWRGDAEGLREALTALRGVGLELADRILLFVFRRPAWPTSRASMRVACRHGWIDPGADYDEWQTLFVRGLDGDVDRLGALATAIDRVGKDWCRKRPECAECPLAPLLPGGRPIELGESE